MIKLSGPGGETAGDSQALENRFANQQEQGGTQIKANCRQAAHNEETDAGKKSDQLLNKSTLSSNIGEIFPQVQYYWWL